MNPIVVIAMIVGLMVLAMLFFLFEMLTPSFGIMTVLGVICLGVAIGMGFMMSSLLGLVLAVASVIGVPAYFLLVVRLLPRTRAGKKLFLERLPEPSGSGAPEAAVHKDLVGQTGVVETTLRPCGAVRIAGQRIVAIAESGVIAKGTTVRVVGADGMNVIVRKIGAEG